MSSVMKLHIAHIAGTPKHSIVKEATAYIEELKYENATYSVYLSTRSLKHCYDKRTAQEFDFILSNLNHIISSPNKIYRNKSSKRGEICVTKKIQDSECLCSLEIIKVQQSSAAHIVTFFIASPEYLSSFELLWERKDGVPSS